LRPIVHAQHPHLAGIRKGCTAAAPQERGGTGHESKLLRESRSCPSSESETDEHERSLQAVGLVGVSDPFQQPLSEDGTLSHRGYCRRNGGHEYEASRVFSATAGRYCPSVAALCVPGWMGGRTQDTLLRSSLVPSKKVTL
jgi:hypothetical protein